VMQAPKPASRACRRRLFVARDHHVQTRRVLPWRELDDVRRVRAVRATRCRLARRAPLRAARWSAGSRRPRRKCRGPKGLDRSLSTHGTAPGRQACRTTMTRCARSPRPLRRRLD
jgi:hypothetical protein